MKNLEGCVDLSVNFYRVEGFTERPSYTQYVGFSGVRKSQKYYVLGELI
jgi:hypothetical protein